MTITPVALLAALPASLDRETLEVTTCGALRAAHHLSTLADDDTVVVVVPGWTASDGNVALPFPDAASGDVAAADYVSGGEWGDSAQTTWTTVDAWRVGYILDEDGDLATVEIDREPHKIEIEPIEPKCARGHSHDWQAPHAVVGGLEETPGVYGHGGGITETTVCRHCGAYRVYDSWAQDPQTGEQGLEAVEYREADERSLAWIESQD